MGDEEIKVVGRKQLCGIWTRDGKWIEHGQIKCKQATNTLRELKEVGLIGGRLAIESHVYICLSKLLPILNGGRMIANERLRGSNATARLYKNFYNQMVRDILKVSDIAPLVARRAELGLWSEEEAHDYRILCDIQRLCESSSDTLHVT